MHTIYENDSTPKADGFRMPAEYEEQEKIYMLWPHRCDTWSFGAKPAQKAFATVARAIAEFEPVVIGVNDEDYINAQAMLGEDENITVVEMSSDDSWIRDCGPTFVINDCGEVRAVHWGFNAWGGLYDGLYFPWNKDQQVGVKVADLAGAVRYRPDNFVLEGGSIHVDGEGTVLTTSMCLLSPGRNPHMNKEEIEDKLKNYLNVEKVIWVKDGIDPDETTGHIDDVACFVAPGEVACIYTDDETNPFYKPAKEAYDFLCEQTDAKGRKLKVHKICLPKVQTALSAAEAASIDMDEQAEPREEGEPCIASYLNFLIVNDGVIVPQYGDENDELALEQISALFPDRKCVGVRTEQVAFGGGNIHCITQQQPAPQNK